ncbi:MAG: primosomal protein N', partial [Pseudomonadota bacterium]|nr:primosomal protein N' [Pseudomonadota bacterium]
MFDTLYRMGFPGASSTDQEKQSARRVRVLLPLPLEGPYDYRVPPDLPLIPGDFVQVPLGKQTRVGVVWDPVELGTKDSSAVVVDSRLREIEARLETWRMTDSMRRFVDWVSAYSMAAPGAVLRMAMSIPEALSPGRPRIVYRLAENPPDYRATAARTRVVAELTDRPARGAINLARESGTGVGVIRGLADIGVLDAVELSDDAPLPQPDPRLPRPKLSEDQADAAADLVAKTQNGDPSVTLLDGVTGAGKTEV